MGIPSRLQWRTLRTYGMTAILCSNQFKHLLYLMPHKAPFFLYCNESFTFSYNHICFVCARSHTFVMVPWYFLVLAGGTHYFGRISKACGGGCAVLRRRHSRVRYIFGISFWHCYGCHGNCLGHDDFASEMDKN